MDTSKTQFTCCKWTQNGDNEVLLFGGGGGVANGSVLVWLLKGMHNGTSYAVTTLNFLLETMPEVTVEVVLGSAPVNCNNCKMCLFLLIFML